MNTSAATDAALSQPAGQKTDRPAEVATATALEGAVFLAGGAVRDALLAAARNEPPAISDRDWVVVGATAEHMHSLGFRAVGRDFPVFLHPDTGEEYALARTERKSGKGYRGFQVHAAPEVTLEEDLARRDLTINAMAYPGQLADNADDTLVIDPAQLTDPHGGQRDIANRVLRHVTDAFAEDPVRILRVARFAARFSDFSVAPQTMQLMRSMVQAGEVDALVPERVWQELAKGLQEDTPSRMFEVLRACDALRVLLPELDRLWGVPQSEEHHPEIDCGIHTMMVLDACACLTDDLATRYAALMHDLGKGVTPADILPRHTGHELLSAEMVQDINTRLRVPGECADLAQLVAKEHGFIHRATGCDAEELVDFIRRCDGLRRPERFARALIAGSADSRGRLGYENAPYPQKALLESALTAMQSVNTADVAATARQNGVSGQAIGMAIRAAQIAAVEKIRADPADGTSADGASAD